MNTLAYSLETIVVPEAEELCRRYVGSTYEEYYRGRLEGLKFALKLIKEEQEACRARRKEGKYE